MTFSSCKYVNIDVQNRKILTKNLKLFFTVQTASSDLVLVILESMEGSA